MEKELTSQSDYAKEGLKLYRKNQNGQNTFILSLGVNLVEMYLKAIVEEEMGYIPEDLKDHSLLAVCSAINRMNIPHFQIPYAFQRDCQLIQRYYTGARYFDANRRSNNIFSDHDFHLVSTAVDNIEKIYNDYQIIHKKNLEDLTLGL